jgi:class 3 adenylate cyclase
VVVQEPVRGGLPDPAFYSLSGLDQWRAFRNGTAPRSALHCLTGYRLTQADQGMVVLALPRPAWLQFGDGTIDLSVLVELAAAGAVTTMAGPSFAPQVTSISMQHLRPAMLQSGTFSAKGRVLNVGPRFAAMEVLVEDGFGREVQRALASAVIRLLDPPPPLLSGPLRPVEEPTYATPDPYLRPVPNDAILNRGDVEDFGGWSQIIPAWADGRLPLPPAMRLFGIRCLEARDGGTRWSMRASQWLCADRPHIQGGTVLALARSALTAASASRCPVGQSVVVISESLTFLRQAVPDGNDLFAQASVSGDGDLVSSVVKVTDGAGRDVAVGSQTSRLASSSRGAHPDEPTRALLTVAFTDIVDSTSAAERLGDQRWGRLLEDHHAMVRRQLDAFNGREVKTTGDGFLVTFDSPGRALQWAQATRDGVRSLGLDLRIGMHSGECELSGTDLAGVAVHIASRVERLAGAGEIVVSGTVRDLVAGGAFRFDDRGRHALKGLEGDWQVYVLNS